MLSDFWNWCWAVLDHWQVLVTGGFITAILAMIQAKTGKDFPWSGTKWIFLVFLVAAFFLAWRDQYLKSKPKVDIKIIRGGAAVNILEQPPTGTMVYLELLVSNSGPRTGLTRWLVSVKDGENSIRGRTALITGPINLTGKGNPQALPPREKFIPDMTMRAVGEGDFVGGYITATFMQPMSFFEGHAERKVEVTCLDVFGNEWKSETTLYSGAPLDMNRTAPGVR